MYDDSERAGLTTVSQFVPRFFLSEYIVLKSLTITFQTRAWIVVQYA